MEKSITLFIANTADCPDPLLVPEFLATLPAYRQEKICRIIPAEKRIESFAAGLLLQYALKENGVSASTLRVHENGKPAVQGLQFNLSHSQGRVACAAGNCAVGCDVEKIRPVSLKLAEKYFSPEEIMYFRTANEADLAFFQLWTRKESYIKMTGEGLRCPLQSFSAVPDMPVFRDGRPVPAHMQTFQADDFLVSVCTEENAGIRLKYVDLRKRLY